MFHDTHVARLYAAPDTALIIQELCAQPNTILKLPQSKTRRACLTVFCDTPQAARAAAKQLRQLLLTTPQADGYVRTGRVPAADWRDNWKKHFPTRRVSARLIVKPPWRDCAAAPGQHVIELNPGLSFGTGLHPTTRACLKLLDRCAGPAPAGAFLDLGCGSGILAIAAAYLGFKPILALDHDPQAVRATRQNSKANGFTQRITCRPADVKHLNLIRRFDLVTANLLAGLLIEAAPLIAATVADHGKLIIAGILREQYSDVLRAYQHQGFSECENIIDGEWQTGVIKRAFQ